MRRIVSTAALAAALCSAVTARPLDLDAIKARGTLRVIVAADEAPETFALQAGVESGFERELLEGFARLRGFKIDVVVAKAYSDRIPMLLKGEGDVIAAIFDTPERRRQVDFTVEVMPTHNVAVTLAPRPPVSRLAELKTLKVGVIKGAKPAETAQEAGVPVTALVGFDRLEDLLDALKKGDVAAGILPVSEMALAAKRIPGMQAGVTIGAPGQIAWAVRKEDQALRGILDEYLGNIRRGSSWSRLIVKYFGDQALSVLGRSRP
jgi:ABC-type amino acid transport substrate-binding protein